MSPSRDDRILNHIGLYTISLRAILEKLFFEGKNSGNVIQRLIRQNKIVSRSGLPSRVRYYQLTPSEAIARNVPVHRTEPIGTQAINKHLAILWYCSFSDGTRHRIERSVVQDRISAELPAGDYMIERLMDSHRILRMRVASSDAEDASILRWVRKEVTRAAENPLLLQLQRTRQIGYLLLADTQTRVPSLERSLTDSGIMEDAWVEVDFAPSPQTLMNAIRKL